MFQKINRWESQLNRFLLIAPILFIGFVTLSPFNFIVTPYLTPQQIVAQFDFVLPTTERQDIVLNVLLFMPLGMSVAYVLGRQKRPVMTNLFLLLIITFGTSLSMELLQVFLPRTPALRDLLTNTLGGVSGYLFYHIQGKYWLKKGIFRAKHLPPPLWRFMLIGILLLYSSLVLVLAARVKPPDLSNWQTDFRLNLGNELSGNAPWHGFIADFYATASVLPDAEIAHLLQNQQAPKPSADLLAAFHLAGENYQDRSGHLADLRWRGTPKNIQERPGFITVTPDYWLQTSAVATALSAGIREASTFTIGAIVASAEPWQTGSGRIVSISRSSQYRNFMLGQLGPHLLVRLRTLADPHNGTNPEIIIPNVFVDTAPHHIIVTYDGFTLKTFVDKIERVYALPLTPEIRFMRYPLVIPRYHWVYYFSNVGALVHRLLYSLLVFAAWGCLLRLVPFSTWPKAIGLVALSIGILIFPIALEAIYAQGILSAMRPSAISYGVAAIIIILILLHWMTTDFSILRTVSKIRS